MKEPIFIVGLPRAGSTLWLNIFAGSPEVCRMGEMLYLTPWRRDFRYFLRKCIGDLSSDQNVEKMLDAIFRRRSMPGITASFWFHDIGKVRHTELREKLSRKIRNSNRTLGDVFRILIQEIASYQGYQRCCVKFPVYVNYVPKLQEWFPKCKVIHITRDPRAMVVSRKSDPEGTERKTRQHPRLRFIIKLVMSTFVAVQYVWTSRLHERYRRRTNYALFRFEDLLADPEKVIKEVCEFSGIDFNRRMLQPEKGQASSVTGKRQGGFNKAAASHWKGVMSPLEEKVLAFLTKESMRRFGYDQTDHSSSRKLH